MLARVFSGFEHRRVSKRGRSVTTRTTGISRRIGGRSAWPG